MTNNETPQTAITTSDSSVIVFHYHRGDGDYREAGLWIWDGTGEKLFHAHEVRATGSDDFGVIFHIDLDALTDGRTPHCRRIGFIPRIHKSWSFKDGHDRYWEPKRGNEIWLVEEDERLHRTPPQVDPRVRCAFIDDLDRILVNLSHPVERTKISPAAIEFIADGNDPIAVARVVPHGEGERIRNFDIFLQAPLDRINRLYTVRLNGYRETLALPRNVMFDRQRFHCDETLGAICEENATTFRYFSPGATRVDVIVFDNEEHEGLREITLNQKGRGVWEGHAKGDLEGKLYSLRVATAARPEAHQFADPHALSTVGNSKWARITRAPASASHTDTASARLSSIEKPTDAVIYEVHVRDFTISPDSGAQHRGKYLGFVEARTHHPQDPSCRTGIDHLRELGVTHVQLLPVQDFDNDEANPEYNWGYMTAFFNSPEGWYATDYRDGSRIAELKHLINALHDAGIGVIMDVVYNHTGEMNTLEELAPRYYHRFRDNGTKHNGSGTGNEFRSEAPMARKFIVDSCVYWMKQYGVDGFRFDLMGLIDIETMKEVRAELHKINPAALVYGEPWTGGEAGISQITDKWTVRGTGIGAFNDNYRNALKGESDGTNTGYVQTGQGRDAIIRGISGSIDDWTCNPADSINYASCHDNLTLWDKLEISTSEPEEERIKMQMLTFGILAVSQGVLFLHGGSEFCRTKYGDENSYQSPDKINQLKWGRKRRYKPVFDYYQAMIALRKSHPLFRLAGADEVRRRLQFHFHDLPAHESICFTIDGCGLEGETWSQAIVIINPLRDEQQFQIPGDGPLGVHVLGSRAMTKAFDQVQDKVSVPGRSLFLGARLYQK